MADSSEAAPTEASDCYLGIPYAEIVRKWWAMYNDSQEPVKSNRNTLTFELAVNLRHICGFDRGLLDRVIPCYDGFAEAEKLACIDNALSEKRTQMPKRLKDVLIAIRQERMTGGGAEPGEADGIDEALAKDDLFYYEALPRMPQGVKDSIDAVGPALALPVRCLTLNNTVANLAERLSNTNGQHAFSFTPEADTVAQKWRSAMSDFSVMLR